MRNIIIGTAGHVDHGKTTLIKALTGVDTDRLKEEKERGMTIDLGFASLDLPNGRRVGIVDVPGHERFIKNMLAGAGGIDVALLVIAADESVMPQTTEHLEILQLLEVKHGVVALTKADMVDEDWLRMAEDDVRRALADTFLADSPVIPVSAITGTGLTELVAALQEACESVPASDSVGPFRLPIDRVFTLQGFGTVVTGTLVAGTVRAGDAVEILPSGLSSRVRQIQVHGKKAESAPAGTRVALNLVGLEVSDLSRGDVVAVPGSLKTSDAFDLELTALDSAPKPLRNRARVRLYVGTSELLGRMTLLDRDELKPGEKAFAQFRSESPAVSARGDRFVIRSYSPMLTIGGGVVLDPAARRRRRFDRSVLSALETASKGSPRELLEQALMRAISGIAPAELRKSADADLLGSLIEDGTVVELEGGRLMHAAVLGEHSRSIRDALARFHDRNPLKPGMPKEELRTTVGSLDARTFTAMLARMEGIGVSDTLACLPEKTPQLTPQQQAAADMIVGELERARYNVPAAQELLQTATVPPPTARELLDLLAHRGKVIRVAEGLYFHESTIRHAEKLLLDHLSEHGCITVSQFRDLTNSSRKYALPLLEYFDSRKLTRRVGDERIPLRPREE